MITEGDAEVKPPGTAGRDGVGTFLGCRMLTAAEWAQPRVVANGQTDEARDLAAGDQHVGCAARRECCRRPDPLGNRLGLPPLVARRFHFAEAYQTFGQLDLKSGVRRSRVSALLYRSTTIPRPADNSLRTVARSAVSSGSSVMPSPAPSPDASGSSP